MDAADKPTGTYSRRVSERGLAIPARQYQSGTHAPPSARFPLGAPGKRVLPSRPNFYTIRAFVITAI